MAIHLRLQGNILVVPVKVTPKGNSNQVLPFGQGDVWVKVKVTAPPEDGAANTAVRTLLGKQLKIPISQLQIIKGHQSRQKQVGIAVSSADELTLFTARLAQVMQTDPGLCFSR